MKKKKSNIRPSAKGSHNRIQQPKVFFNENRYADWIGMCIIILLGTIIYSNSFQCSFHFDDLNSIVDNTKIRDLFDVKTIWVRGQNRFVAYYSFAINYHFGKLNVWGFHFVNLTIHLVNACLVYWLTWLIFSSPGLVENPVTRHKKTIAFLTALLFVSHPLATQSVTYIVQRMSSMVAMFYLLSLALYVKARLNKKGNVLNYLLFAGSLLFAVLAMLTKENAYTLPFAIVLFEIFFLQTKKLAANFKDYRVILFIAALIITSVVVLFKFSLSIFNPLPPSQGNAVTITSMNYLLTQFSVIVKYIQLLFIPVYQNADYDFPVIHSFFETRTLLSFLLLLALIILAIFFFKRNRIISFGLFWFFLTLSVESGIVPINDVIFEHRTYLPSFGFFLILSYGMFVLFWNKNKYITIAVLLMITGSNSALTYQRNKIWKDDLTLWSDTVSKSPKKARPHFNLGLAYQNLDKPENAIDEYTKAIEINPQYTNAWSNRGLAYFNLGQLDKAIFDNSKAIEINPKYSTAYNYLGLAYDNLGQPDKAIEGYSKAIEVDPNFADAYSNRGVVYGKLGQWTQSIADFSKAIEIDPEIKAAYSNREIAYKKLNSQKK